MSQIAPKTPAPKYQKAPKQASQIAPLTSDDKGAGTFVDKMSKGPGVKSPIENKIDPTKLVLLPVLEVKPNPTNRNKHPPEQIARLCDIIRYQGFRQPVIVSSRSGYVVVGHGRLEAAKSLGMSHVPVVFQDFESEAQEFAFQVSDNAIAAWAELDLTGINEDLATFGASLDADLLGIKDFVLTPTETVPQCDEDEVPEFVEPKTKLGDIYQLGRHRLMCGDSTSIDAVEKLMNGQKADMVFTDPPYNTGMQASNRGGSARLTHMFDDKFSDADWQALLQGFISTMWAAMADNSAAYVCLDWRRSHELVPHLKEAFKFSNMIIWDKVVHGLGSDYKYTHEFIHVCKKGDPEIRNKDGDKEYSDVWHIQRKMGRDEEHATKKPVELVERCISHASKPGQSVLDLFCGSGSTLVAAEKLGRAGFFMELSPSYVDTAVARWEKYTGQTAKLLEK